MRPSNNTTGDFQERVRRWVRENLKRLGWSQAELSRQMGQKDSSYIGHSLRGARDFKAEEIAQMATLFERPFPDWAERSSVEQLRAPAKTQAEGAAPHRVLVKLAALDADSLSPREAHEILCALTPREALDTLYALKKEL